MSGTMAKQRRKGPSYPGELLDDVAWSFTDPPFASQDSFVQAVADYSKDLEWEFEWRPDEVVLRCPRVQVRAETYDDPEELAPGVSFDEHTGDMVADLTAAGEEGFTAGELLWKIHNAFTTYLSKGDHHFFEGLMLVKKRNANPNEPPVYEVMTGS